MLILCEQSPTQACCLPLQVNHPDGLVVDRHLQVWYLEREGGELMKRALMLVVMVLGTTLLLQGTCRADGTPLYIITTNPFTNSAGASVQGPYTITFSVRPDTPTVIELRRSDNNAAVPYAWVEAQDTDMWTFRITPSIPLDWGVSYYLAIPATLYTTAGGSSSTIDPADAHNAPYWNAGQNEFRVSFTTAPPLSAMSSEIGGVPGPPTGGQGNVKPLNVQIRLRFNNALNPATVNAGTVVLREGSVGGPTVPLSFVGLDPADGSQKTLLVAPEGTLHYSTAYYLVIENVTDVNGSIVQ